MAKVQVANLLHAGRRHRDPDQRRARLFQGHGAGVDLPLRPAGAAGRRRRRGPQDGAQPLPRNRAVGLLVMACRRRCMSAASGRFRYPAAEGLSREPARHPGRSVALPDRRRSVESDLQARRRRPPHGAAQEAAGSRHPRRPRGRPRVPRAQRLANTDVPVPKPILFHGDDDVARHSILPDGMARRTRVPRRRSARPRSRRRGARSTCRWPKRWPDCTRSGRMRSGSTIMGSPATTSRGSSLAGAASGRNRRPTTSPSSTSFATGFRPICLPTTAMSRSRTAIFGSATCSFIPSSRA